MTAQDRKQAKLNRLTKELADAKACGCEADVRHLETQIQNLAK
jgi:translation initiation factor 1 (eIF-1/SUI1)